MLSVIVSMRDELNGFMNIGLDKSVESAKRGFMHAMAIAAPDHLFYSHPEDYSVWQLGTFDSESGKIDLLPTPVLIMRGEKRV